MIKHRIKIAFRHLWRNRTYSFINIAGLAVGLACSIMILLMIVDELSFDRFHKNRDRIGRIVEDQSYPGGDVFQTPQTPPPLAETLRRDYPEVEQSCRVGFASQKVLFDYSGKRFYEENGLYVDPSFFDIFSFELKEGNPSSALREPHSILITERLAEKYFGRENALGQTIRLSSQHDFKVTGVVTNPPRQSHLSFDFLIPFEFQKSNRNLTEWGSNWHRTYILLKPGADIGALSEKIKGVIKKNHSGSITDLWIQPMNNIYLHTAFNGATPKITYVYILSAIALLVLLIACINFMNLSTARSMKRSREVGLQKVVGAQRLQLVRQFLGEAVLMALLAAVIALFLIEGLMPFFNSLTGKQLSLAQMDGGLVMVVAGVVLGTGLLAGLYPAFILSAFRPVEVLKGDVHSGKQGSRFRRGLVIVQFTMSAILMINTMVVYQQLEFIRNKPLGFEKESLLSVPLRGSMHKSYDRLKSEWLQNPGVVAISAAQDDITNYGSSTWDVSWKEKLPGDRILTTVTAVDYDYLTTLGIKLAAGRTFSRDYPSDTTSVVINQRAAKAMGFEDPVGQVLDFWGSKWTVIGMVEDYHFESVHVAIPPLILGLGSDHSAFHTAHLKLRSDQMAGTMRTLEQTWQRLAAEYPFEYSFLDEDLDRMYKGEQRLSKIFASFAVLAILISCLGLFGLSAYTTEQRFKEIGVRKVLGASVSSVTFLLSRQFLGPVLVAVVLACPVGYGLMRMWLDQFAYRTGFPFLMLGGVALGAVVIAMATVGYQAIRAAVGNPIDALRYE